MDRINIYNAGSKFTRLLLNIVNNDSNSLLELEPRLKRKLKYNWKPISEDVLKVRIKSNVINLIAKSSSLDYFKKYSELKLSSERFEYYKTRYAGRNSNLS